MTDTQKELGDDLNAGMDAQKEEEETKEVERKAERIEHANKRLADALKQQEELLAREKVRMLLGGKSEGGKALKSQQDMDNERYDEAAEKYYEVIYGKRKK